MIAIDVYGLVKYSWGNQFYIMMIESLILSVSQLFIHLCEFKEQKKAMRPYDQESLIYAEVPDSSSIDQKFEEEMRKRLGGLSLEEFLRELKEKQAIESAAYNPRDVKKCDSMPNIGDRTMEGAFDDRRVNTYPMDEKPGKKYDNYEMDRYPNNCIAEPG